MEEGTESTPSTIVLVSGGSACFPSSIYMDAASRKPLRCPCYILHVRLAGRDSASRSRLGRYKSGVTCLRRFRTVPGRSHIVRCFWKDSLCFILYARASRRPSHANGLDRTSFRRSPAAEALRMPASLMRLWLETWTVSNVHCHIDCRSSCCL